MRVAIVDDEPPARRKMRRLLQRYPDMEVVGEAGCGVDAIALLRGAQPDLVFLDVQMPDMNGFSVLHALNGTSSMQVIFVTAFDHHALEAFEIHALDYLLKPVAPARLAKAVERARDSGARTDQQRLSALLQQFAQRSSPSRRIALQTGESVVFVSPGEIEYAESAGNYVLVHAGGAVHQIRSTLDSFAAQLDPEQFSRINRSQIVNLERVRELRPWFHGDYRALLNGGTELSWSRRYSPRSHLARLQSR